jgi:hypothetical protein
MLQFTKTVAVTAVVGTTTTTTTTTINSIMVTVAANVTLVYVAGSFRKSFLLRYRFYITFLGHNL